MKDTFLLDIDDTLLDFCRLEREQIAALLTRFGERADGEIAARFHAINDGLWKAFERGEVTRERLVVQRFEVLKAEFSLRAEARAMAESFLEGMRSHACLFAGAREFLAELSRRGRLYAVTNGAGDVQRSHMAATGILPFFSALFISEEVGHRKPSAEYAAYVAAHIPGFAPARSLYLGDSLTSDMVCAKLLGTDFVLFCPAGMVHGYGGMAAQTYGEVLALADAL